MTMSPSHGAIPEVSFIYFNAQEYVDAKWCAGGVHTVGLMSEAALEAIVQEKEAKAAEYNPCDAYWLLVVVDWIDPAQEQEIRIDDRPWSLRTCLKKSSSTSPISSTSLKSSDARRRARQNRRCA